MSDPVDYSSNYVQPTTVQGPTKFTATVSASTSEEAEILARQQAREQAFNAFGRDTTQFVSFDDMKVRLNSSVPQTVAGNALNAPGTTNVLNTTSTYTATFTTNAIQLSPPSQSGEVTEQITPEQQQSTEDLNQSAAETARLNRPQPQQEPEDLNQSAAETARLNRVQNPDPTSSNQTSGIQRARESGQAGIGGGAEVPQDNDFRFKISLAAGANYLYKAPGITTDPTNILQPLVATDGVIFPYTPQISVTYNANYEPSELAHFNYRIYNYKNSGVENISIIGDFTAQDTAEANYLLAVIHFFRSVTKMFYGQDTEPIAGIPPPLCYLRGYGTYGFNNHQVAITNFTLNYPNDVDYINASPSVGGESLQFVPYKEPTRPNTRLFDRIKNGNRNGGLQAGGLPSPPRFTQGPSSKINTRVPTKLQIQLSCIPIVTRLNIATQFSLKDYANGKLIQRGFW